MGNSYFGKYGGTFIPETLSFALEELENLYREIKDDRSFKEDLKNIYADYVGRPSPLYFAETLTNNLGGPKVWFKREDLNHTGAHKINNTVGQALLAKKLGKQRIIAETGAGQHGVATATICAKLNLDCVIYMGETDIERQELNVFKIKTLGAEVIPVSSGTATLKDALNESIRDWVTNVDSTHYIIGSVTGPHPYPMIVRDFNSVVGEELIEQSKVLFNTMPDAIVACVGGGSNAMGAFYPFININQTRLIGVEAAGNGLQTGEHAAPLNDGSPGVLHGALSYLMQDEAGQVKATKSVSAGLDYPGVGPEHSWLKDSGRAEYVAVDDDEALEAFHQVSELEGIIPALETAHAFAYLETLMKEFDDKSNIIVNVSGRGDKDINTVAEIDGIKI